MTKVKTTTLRHNYEEDDSLFISGPADLDADDLGGSDNESGNDDERAHNNLMTDISKIIRKKKMGAAPRNVRITTKEGGTNVNTKDILKRIGVRLDKTPKQMVTLHKPLEKITVKRVKRVQGYEKVACEVGKWANLVQKRRDQEQVRYPLQQADVRINTALKKEEIRMRTPLEQEVYALLQGAKLTVDKKESNEVIARKRAMSLEELKERNRLAFREKEEKRRVERKAWRQNKNKSRKFHRLLRRDQRKQERSELEELKKTDPESAMDRLEVLEKARVQERMTLRHKRSKWVHLQGLRANRDEKAMAAVTETQNMHKDLTAKRKLDDSSDDDDDDVEQKLELLRKERENAIEAGLFDPSNPWTASLMEQLPERMNITPDSAIDDSFVNFKKFWDEVNRRKLIEKEALDAVVRKAAAATDEENDVSDATEEEEGINSSDDDDALERTKESDKEEDSVMENGDDYVGEEGGCAKHKGPKKAVELEVGENKKSAVESPTTTNAPAKKKKKNLKKKKVNEANKVKNTEDINCKVEEKKKVMKKKGDKISQLKLKKQIRKAVETDNGDDVNSADGKELKKAVELEVGANKKSAVESPTTTDAPVKKNKKNLKKKKVNEANMVKNKEDGNGKVEEKKKVMKKKGDKNSQLKLKKQIRKAVEIDNGDNVNSADGKADKSKQMKTGKKRKLDNDSKKQVTKKKKNLKSNNENVEDKDEKGNNKKVEKVISGVKTERDKAIENVDLEDHLISIDNMFNQAELGLQRKLKKRLQKLGIKAASGKEWTKVKSKNLKKEKVEEKTQKSILPKIEEFEFTVKKDIATTEEGIERPRTMEDMDALQHKKAPRDNLKEAEEILKGDHDGLKESNSSSVGKTLASKSGGKGKSTKKPAQVDPLKFLQVDAKMLQSAMPDTITRGDEALDDDDEDEDAEDIIREAFADDYGVDEFKSAKKDAIEKDKPKPLDLVLPGWGEWTGPNMKVSKRKIRKYTIRAPPPAPRRDATLSNVIYNEEADLHKNVRQLMVSVLPYPFKRVQDFEASVRAPIGRTFVPEEQHKKLTAPPVITKMGTIIEPMTEEELLTRKDIIPQKRKRKRGKKVTTA